MKLFFPLIVHGLAIASGLPEAFSAAHAAEEYLLCNRNAEITVASATPVTTNDPCTGSVILQGISYQCGPLSEVDRKRESFLASLKVNGREFCQQYCAERSSLHAKCEGVFHEPDRCGYTVPTAEALRFGKEMAPCNPTCGGTAFAYCSITMAASCARSPTS